MTATCTSVQDDSLCPNAAGISLDAGHRPEGTLGNCGCRGHLAIPGRGAEVTKTARWGLNG